MMITDAVNLNRFVINKKSLVWIELQRANSKRSFVIINQSIPLAYRSDRNIPIWFLLWWWSPKIRVGDGCVAFGEDVGHRRQVQVHRFKTCHGISLLPIRA